MEWTDKQIAQRIERIETVFGTGIEILNDMQLEVEIEAADNCISISKADEYLGTYDFGRGAMFNVKHEKYEWIFNMMDKQWKQDKTIIDKLRMERGRVARGLESGNTLGIVRTKRLHQLEKLDGIIKEMGGELYDC